MLRIEMKRQVRRLLLPAVVLTLAALACGEGVSPTQQPTQQQPTQQQSTIETPTPTAERLPTLETAPEATPTLEPTANVPGCIPDAGFQADVTVPDNTRIEIGRQFVKTWRVRNTGTCNWGPDYRFTFVGGDQMGGPDWIVVPETPAGESAEISVELVAPNEEGQCRGNWQVCVSGGECIGDKIYVQIVAFDPSKAAATAPPASSVPTVTPADTPQPTAPPAPPPGDYLAPGVWRCPNSTQGAAYVGSTESDKFHFLGCHHAAKIEPANRIYFESREAALNHGYVPCGGCNP